MADTTPRAAEALARALIRAGIWVDADDPGLASPQEYAAVMLADEDITDSERAALVAALLDGHEGVLAGAIVSAGDAEGWPNINTGTAARYWAPGIIAALAGKEPTDG